MWQSEILKILLDIHLLSKYLNAYYRLGTVLMQGHSGEPHKVPALEELLFQNPAVKSQQITVTMPVGNYQILGRS